MAIHATPLRWPPATREESHALVTAARGPGAGALVLLVTLAVWPPAVAAMHAPLKGFGAVTAGGCVAPWAGVRPLDTEDEQLLRGLTDLPCREAAGPSPLGPGLDDGGRLEAVPQR